MSAQIHVETYNHLESTAVKEKRFFSIFNKKKKTLDPGDTAIIATLEKLKKDLDTIHSSLDSVTDPILIDSFIYEMNAVNMRYKFYLKMCKEKGLISDLF